MSIEFRSQGAVAVVTIDRPEVANAIDRPTAAALADAFRRFEADESLHVAVLTGANGTFCAGADLKAMREPGMERASRLDRDGDGPVGPTRMLLAKPVIAAVEGHAVAGGFELAAWCDLRVAAENAVFGVYCRRWGIPLMDGGTIRLARLIGHSHALDLILTGRGVSGDEAMRMGLANRLTEPGDARRLAIALASELAALPQVCMREDRASSYAQWGLGFDEAIQVELEHGLRVLRSGESLAGASRFAAGAGRHGAAAES